MIHYDLPRPKRHGFAHAEKDAAMPNLTNENGGLTLNGTDRATAAGASGGLAPSAQSLEALGDAAPSGLEQAGPAPGHIDPRQIDISRSRDVRAFWEAKFKEFESVLARYEDDRDMGDEDTPSGEFGTCIENVLQEIQDAIGLLDEMYPLEAPPKEIPQWQYELMNPLSTIFSDIRTPPPQSHRVRLVPNEGSAS